MTSQWVLPLRAEFDGCVYDINGDFRDVLEIMAYLHTADRITLCMQECAERPARDEVFCKTAKQAFPHI
jgi:hypothetical protein